MTTVAEFREQLERETHVAQAVAICRACAATPPDKYGWAPDTDHVLMDQGYEPVSYALAYDARVEAVKRAFRTDSASIYQRCQATDRLAAKLLRDGWLPWWYEEGMFRT